jgi:molecular chaperone DnaK (HSP70)
MTANEVGTTGYNNIKIVPYTPSLSQDKIICMIKRFKKFTSKDKKIKERVTAKNQLKS